jgi:uncharacterized lipoprotein YddW (UPF0748 family)
MLIRITLIFLTLVAYHLSPAYSQNDDKVAVLWCDPLLNISQITNRNGIINIINKARDSGFKAIALGVKTITGEVIYKSKKAPRLFDWQGSQLPVRFDPVQIFLNEARLRNIEIYAVFSLFSEGHLVERKGPIYTNRLDWQTKVYVIEDGEPTLTPVTEWGYGTAAFANPLLREVQDYEIAIVNEFIQNYNVDGLIFDKGRFSGIEADFSDHSKNEFEKFLGGGRKVNWWPEEVYELKLVNEESEIVPGPLFQEWLEFRSKSIQSFFKRLVNSIRSVDTAIPVANFVGAWYPTYYEYGVNWASETNVPEEDWASSDYPKTALAEIFDYLVVGCFFPRITMEDAENVDAKWWMSVEGSSIIAREVVGGASPVHASLMVEQFKDNADTFKKALSTALNLNDGLYVYDFSQIEKYKYWDELGDILKGESKPGSKLPVRAK